MVRQAEEEVEAERIHCEEVVEERAAPAAAQVPVQESVPASAPVSVQAWVPAWAQPEVWT